MEIKILSAQKSASDVGGFNISFMLDGDQQPISHIYLGMKTPIALAVMEKTLEFVKKNGADEMPDLKSEMDAMEKKNISNIENEAKNVISKKLEAEAQLKNNKADFVKNMEAGNYEDAFDCLNR